MESRTDSDLLATIKMLDDAPVAQDGRMLWYKGYWYFDGNKLTEEEFQELMYKRILPESHD